MIYTNKFINFISCIITIIIFLFFNFYFFKNPKITDEKISNIISNIKIIKENNVDEEKNITKNVDLENWYIQIPAINLSAPIAEGTNSDILSTKVGHFIDTAKDLGNIGLAAHNRGYEFNYFKDLKKLKVNDEIIYNYENFKKVYIVEKNDIIKNTDWSYLDTSKENKITLITCVENNPQYRRCIQGTEKEN